MGKEVRFFCNVGMLIIDRKGIPRFKSRSQIRFTDFGSRFIRRPSGELFSVKVAAGR